MNDLQRSLPTSMILWFCDTVTRWHEEKYSKFPSSPDRVITISTMKGMIICLWWGGGEKDGVGWRGMGWELDYNQTNQKSYIDHSLQISSIGLRKVAWMNPHVFTEVMVETPIYCPNQLILTQKYRVHMATYDWLAHRNHVSCSHSIGTALIITRLFSLFFAFHCLDLFPG